MGQGRQRAGDAIRSALALAPRGEGRTEARGRAGSNAAPMSRHDPPGTPGAGCCPAGTCCSRGPARPTRARETSARTSCPGWTRTPSRWRTQRRRHRRHRRRGSGGAAGRCRRPRSGSPRGRGAGGVGAGGRTRLPSHRPAGGRRLSGRQGRQAGRPRETGRGREASLRAQLPWGRPTTQGGGPGAGRSKRGTRLGVVGAVGGEQADECRQGKGWAGLRLAFLGRRWPQRQVGCSGGRVHGRKGRTVRKTALSARRTELSAQRRVVAHRGSSWKLVRPIQDDGNGPHSCVCDGSCTRKYTKAAAEKRRIRRSQGPKKVKQLYTAPVPSPSPSPLSNNPPRN